MKNLKEFKELILRYESITLEEIEELENKLKNKTENFDPIAEDIAEKIGEVYRDVPKIKDPEKQGEILTELEDVIIKGSRIERKIRKKTGKSPFEKHKDEFM